MDVDESLELLPQSPDSQGEEASSSPNPHRDLQLERYQTALEEVLTWLLSAEDSLQAQSPISNQVEVVKEQFHTHEVWWHASGLGDQNSRSKAPRVWTTTRLKGHTPIL